MNSTTSPFRITLILDGSSAVAQMEQMERILDDDGTVITARALPAEPLDFPLSEAILGAVNTAALDRIAALEAELETARAAPVDAAQGTTIRAWQAKAVLALAGALESAERVIDGLPEPQRTVVKSAWDNNADFSRESQTIIALAAALSLTDEQLDAMFAQAAALTV